MKITIGKQNKKFRQINFYKKNVDKKLDSKKDKFLNINIEEGLNTRKFISLIRGSVMRAKTHKQELISFDYTQIKNLEVDNMSDEDKAKIFTENIILAEYKFDKFKTQKSNRIKEVLIFNTNKKENEKILEGMILGENINISRDLSNTSGIDMTPSILASKSKEVLKGSKTKIKILEEKDAKKLNMGLFLSVGKGSQEPSKFIEITYSEGKKSERPIILIGKGVTFDTGGINLKPSDGILGMNMDMTGGAVVLSTLKAVNDLKIKNNIVVLIPAVENAISGKATRPGDIIKSMSGKTVQINNTDAEGRLILADAITYSKKFNPSIIIDVATLTGAALVAVGQKATAFMTKDKDLETYVRNLGEKTGDYMWPLPLFDEFENDMQSEFADLSNLGKTKYGGSSTAGIFLYQFIKDLPKDMKWIHLDIAPRMESAEGDNLEKGATGEPVRLLVEFIRNYDR